ncbi:hypothetical protein D9M71_605150 [compost metagenome]
MDQQRPALHAADDGLDQWQVMVIDDQDRRVAVVQRIGDFRGAPADVHQVQHRPGPPAGEHGFLVTVGVQRQYGDPFALAQPEVAQAGGQTGDTLGGFAIGTAATTVNGGRVLRGQLQRNVQTLGQMHEWSTFLVVIHSHAGPALAGPAQVIKE